MCVKYGFICAILSCIACAPSPDTASDRLYWAEVDIPPAPEVTEALLATGAQVYQSSCASCHGITGRGDGTDASTLTTKPRDFAFALFKLRSTDGFPTDADLYRSITVGFPAYGMPSNDHLGTEERWALVHHVKSLIHTIAPDKSLEPGTPIVMPKPKKYTQASINLGKVLYNKMSCAFCHGPKGDVSPSMALVDAQGNPIRPRNFRDGPETFKGGGRPEDIVRILMTGLAGTPMQPFGRIGSDNEELWDVAHYVHYLATTPKEDTP